MVTDLHTELDLVRDFVNTFDFETGVDDVATPDELAMWFSEQGLVDDLVEPTEQEAQLGVRFEGGRPVLAPEDDGARGALGRIVAAVAELAPTDDWKRLKTCRDENCRVAFYDKSRNRSRAWCSMEVCGNREKARSFRHRHATSAS
jgi:hypothetical protein